MAAQLIYLIIDRLRELLFVINRDFPGYRPLKRKIILNFALVNRC